MPLTHRFAHMPTPQRLSPIRFKAYEGDPLSNAIETALGQAVRIPFKTMRWSKREVEDSPSRRIAFVYEQRDQEAPLSGQWLFAPHSPLVASRLGLQKQLVRQRPVETITLILPEKTFIRVVFQGDEPLISLGLVTNLDRSSPLEITPIMKRFALNLRARFHEIDTVQRKANP